MVGMEVNVLRTGRAEANINCPSDLFLPHSLLCSHVFFCFLFSERKSGKNKSFSLEFSERL